MNRNIVSNVQCAYRKIQVDGANYKNEVDAWTERILSKQPCVPDGYRFIWSSDSNSASNSAYLFDAVMCNVQYAQHQIYRASSMVGKRAYVASMDAANVLSRVLTELMPKWTFRPLEVYNLEDARESDIYGHYCLARAIAYDNVGKADLKGTPSAHIAAKSNAAHLYCVAAETISGDVGHMLDRAQICTADALAQWGSIYLDRWEAEEDDRGAAKALACYTEAHSRYADSGHAGCADKVEYATERNQVHWLEPVLPEWVSLVRPRVTACKSL